jgi:hypothetical protein
LHERVRVDGDQIQQQPDPPQIEGEGLPLGRRRPGPGRHEQGQVDGGAGPVAHARRRLVAQPGLVEQPLGGGPIEGRGGTSPNGARDRPGQAPVDLLGQPGG